jgi:hypothetical protein
MFKLFIQGYGDSSVIDKAGFKIDMRNQDNYATLFLGYSDYEVNVGEKIKTIYQKGKLLFVDLEIKSVYVGIGKPIEHIPLGYKSLILVKGTSKDILAVKNALYKVNGWNQSPEDYTAISDKLKIFNSKGDDKKRVISISGNTYTVTITHTFTKKRGEHVVYALPSRMRHAFEQDIKKRQLQRV